MEDCARRPLTSAATDLRSSSSSGPSRFCTNSSNFEFMILSLSCVILWVGGLLPREAHLLELVGAFGNRDGALAMFSGLGNQRTCHPFGHIDRQNNFFAHGIAQLLQKFFGTLLCHLLQRLCAHHA